MTLSLEQRFGEDGYVELGTETATLRVGGDGRLTLFRKSDAGGAEEAAAHAFVGVPPPAEGASSSSGAAGESRFSITREAGGSAIVISWPGRAVLRVLPVDTHRMCGAREAWLGDLHHHGGFVLQFTALRGDESEVTVDMESSGSWYGGGHLMKQHWPLNRGCWEVGPYYPFDNGPNGVNTLIHPHWVTTGGLLVIANPDTPYLHVGMNAPRRPGRAGARGGRRARARKWGVGIQNWTRQNLPMVDSPNLRTLYGEADGQLRLQARSNYECDFVTHPLRYWRGQAEGAAAGGGGPPTMEFVLSVHENVREATRAALKTLTAPPRPPPEALIRAPIWTTWARYHEDVDQRKVLKFAREIIARGMPRSVMEIDDKWQAHYGDISFCRRKFPDPGAMVRSLHDLGFKVTVWVHPFVEERSEAYEEGRRQGFFIVEDETERVRHALQMLGDVVTGGLKPGFFRWWHREPVVALDVTNPRAVDWFVRRLRRLQSECEVDGFKFDAGEPCFLPGRFKTHRPVTSPSEYTRLWVEEVASKFEVAEVRTGHKTQSAPLLTRMGDRFSTWDLGNGLRSLIPTLMTSSVLGYPFCLPDMVGGNAYFGNNPDEELMVRWAQVNALMPAIQFSIAPWDVGADALALTRDCLSIRERIVPRMLALANEAGESLEPPCRPLWWLDPHDEETYAILDQFAIGDEIVVAPVVERGAVARDVYLPRGRWVELDAADDDDAGRDAIEGGQWLRGVHAPLSKLPCYVRVRE